MIRGITRSMKDATAVLAQSITRASSKQTYYTGRLMVDRDLVRDFYHAYAYFRWADDIIDITSKSKGERLAFIKKQQGLIDTLYRGEIPDELGPEEKIIASLIRRDRGANSGLQSFIRNMFAIITFDAARKGRLISQSELAWYTESLGRSVTDGLHYFIGNRHHYPTVENRNHAAIAAHITHLLRDMLSDIADGFINIPWEYLEANGIGPEDVDSPAFRRWIKERVLLARSYFREGKRYLDGLDVLRSKIVGYWYCARFERILDVFEKNEFKLQNEYETRQMPSAWLRIFGLGIIITTKHILRRRKKVLK